MIVGGGGLIHEYFNLDIGDLFTNFGYNVAAYSIVPFFANVYQKPLFYWSHGIGPIFSEKAKLFCSWFYSLADCTTVRDRYSYMLLKSIRPEMKNLYLDTDPVNKLEISKFIIKDRFKLAQNKLKIGINMRPWFGQTKLIGEVAEALNILLRKKDNAVVVPVPFDLNLDQEILRKLLSYLPDDKIDKRYLDDISSPTDVISLMNSVDVFIGTRLHSIIMANLLKKPSVAIVYDKKVESAVKNLNTPSVFIGELNSLAFYTLIKKLAEGAIKISENEITYQTPKIFAQFLKGQIKDKTSTQLEEETGEALDGIRIYESFIQSLKNEIEQINKEKVELSSRLQRTTDDYKKLSSAKKQMEDTLNKTVSEKNNLQAELVKTAKEKNEIAEKFDSLLSEKNSLFYQLNQIYSSDFWKVASFYYRMKDKSGILRAIVHTAGKFKHIFSRKNSDITAIQKNQPTKENVGSGTEKKPLDENQRGVRPVTTNYVDFYSYYANLMLPEKNEKYDILFFSIIDWNFRFQRPQHIASRLAKKGHRVFYLKTSLKTGSMYSIEKIDRNIYEIGLPYIEDSNIYSDNLEKGIDTLTNALFGLIKRYSIKEHIYFVEFPMWYKLVKAAKERFGAPVIFDVLDEFSGFKNVNKDISLYEKKMLDISDSVITSSTLLYNKVKNQFKNCHLVKNGTDFKHFSHIKENDLLKNTKKPIIGYYGAISDWFDTDLVEYAAKKHPDWSFVLIGYTFGAKIDRLQKLDNVYFLGEKPYFELPKYLYWFDVCLIPFKDVPLIKSTNPVKFYEYISAGKPVVATKMDELVEFKDIAYIVDGRDDFVKKVEIALKKGMKNHLVKARKSVAKKNDWDKRAREVQKIIKDSFPKVSIIIVTYNNLEYTKLCIQSILEKTAYPNYEVIIVDNGSNDVTIDYLRNVDSDKIHTVFNDDNLGFAKANNIGIKKSRGGYVILLNNDTIVTRGWISGLLRHFKNSVGMVGPVTNSIGNEAKINVLYSSLEDMPAFAEYYTNKHFGEEFEIKVLAMFCVAIKREVIEKTGLIDERYGIGMFEDDDYAMTVKNAGYKLLCAEDVFIHHFGNATFKKMRNGKYMKLFDENRKKFEEKWNIKWIPHRYRKEVN